MPYCMSEMVFLDVKGISPNLLRELLEFIRQNMIVATRAVGGDGSGDQNSAFYSGYFIKAAAEKIEKWLQEKGEPRVQAW